MIPRRRLTWAAPAVVAMVLGGSRAATAQPDTPSLYERLGGLPAISVVVSDFIDARVPDPVLNATPAIDAARKRVPAAYLKYHVTALVCWATGGPCQYHGRTMKEAHAHLNITEKEWDRMVSIFKEVLAEHDVPAKETQERLDIVASTKADIVVSGTGKWGARGEDEGPRSAGALRSPPSSPPSQAPVRRDAPRPRRDRFRPPATPRSHA